MSPAEKPANGRVPQTIIETSSKSWAETDLAPKGQVAMNPEKGDKPGPVSIAVALSAAAQSDAAAKKPDDGEKPETRVVAIGDSDFATNAALGIQGNRDLFMNIVNWLAQQENLIAIRPKDAADRRLTITADQMKILTLMAIVFVPAAVLGVGVFAWWRRRER